jgi:Flp pilus assembly protein TadG
MTTPKPRVTSQVAARLQALRTDEQGTYSIELAILFAGALTLILTIVQAACLFFAQGGALAAAQAGATAGSAYQSSPQAGATAADQFAATQIGDWLTGAQASDTGSSGTQVTITVTGNALSLIPGIDLGVKQSAQETIQRFTD